MADVQKIPPPKPIINKSAFMMLGTISVSQSPKGNMTESSVSSAKVIKSLEEAVKKGAFEGIESNKNE